MPVYPNQAQSQPQAQLTPVGPPQSQGISLPPAAQPKESGKFLSGGFLSDIGDILQTPQFALTGLLSGKGVKKGIEERITPSKALNIKNPLAGFAADVILDPLNLAAGLGIAGKAAKAVGAVKTAEKLAGASKLGTTGILAKSAQKLFRPVTGKITEIAEPAIRKAAQGIEPLSKAEKLRAGQIAKGGISLGEGEEKIRQAMKPIGEVVGEAIDTFPVFGPIKKKVEGLLEMAPKAFAQRKAALESGVAAGRELAVKTGEYLTKGFSPDEQRLLGQFIKGEPVNTIVAKNMLGEEKIKTIETTAGLARRTVDSVSKELVEEMKKGGFGGNKENAITAVLNNIGTYFPREYRKFVEDPKNFVDFLTGGKSTRLITTFLKKRKDIPADVRSQMGEILEAGFPVAKRLSEVTHSVETSKFFRWVAAHLADTANRTGDMVKLSDVQTLGILAGKYVPKIVADDINTIGRMKTIGKAREAYRKFLGYWKFGKVILNPAAQSRNLMSNIILMDLGNYPVFQPEGVKHFLDAATEYVKKGETYRLARKAGLLGGTYFGNEIKNFIVDMGGETGGNILSRGMQAFVRNAGKGYQGMEEISKMAMFVWRMSKGNNMRTASDYAQKWLFDYRNVPEFIRYLRNAPFGYPFITFTSKAIPRLAEAAATNPAKISKYYKAFDHIEGEGHEEEKKLLPEYIKNGMYVRLPFPDKNGNPLYFNMNYILPWGNLELAGQGVLPQVALPSDPAATFLTAFATNTNPFNGKELYKDTDDPDEKNIKIATFIYQTLMPSLAPSIPLTGIIGGYSYEKILDAIFQRPDKMGRLRDLPTTLMDVGFGLKATPVNLEEEAGKRAKEFQRKRGEIQQNIRNIARDQSITDEEERNRRIQKEVEKIEKESQKLNERFGAGL